MWRVLPPHLSDHTRQFLVKKGVQVIPNSQVVESTLSTPTSMTVTVKDVLNGGDTTTAIDNVDHIIVAVSHGKSVLIWFISQST